MTIAPAILEKYPDLSDVQKSIIGHIEGPLLVVAGPARAKIHDFRFHDLRHTFCSWLAIRGVPLTAIQKLAGHKSIKMTLRYAHLSPRYLADEVKALDSFQQDGKKPEIVETTTCDPNDQDPPGDQEDKER